MIASVAAMMSAASAHAQCPASPAPLAVSSPVTKPYVERYNALLAGDPSLYSGRMAAGWRALAGDLERDPAAPAELKAWTYIMLAASLQKDEEVDEGLAAARKALALADAGGLDATPLHAAIMTTLADKEASAGKAAEAVAHADKAIAEATHHYGEQSWALGRAMMSATMATNAFGRYEDTERYAARAEVLAAVCLAPDNPFVGQTITGHSAILGTLGRIEESLDEAERALAWTNAHAPVEDNALPYLLDNYGWTLRNAGRLREAEAVLRRSVDLYARYHHDSWADRASATGKFANVLAAEGHYLEAEAMWLKTREYYAAAHDLTQPLGGTGELRRSADAAQVRGDLPLALARREQAVALMTARVQPQHPELARTKLEYATTLSLMGRTQEAYRVAKPAIEGLRATMADSDFKRWGAEIGYAHILAEASDPAAGYTIAAPVAGRMERALLDAATSRGNLVAYAPAFSASFATVTHLALTTGHDDDAFRNLQLANLSEIVLVNADIAMRAAAANPASRALVEQLQADTRQRRQLDRDRTYAASHHDEAGVRDRQAAIRATDTRIAETIAQLDTAFPAFRAIGRPTPVALAAFQARLGPDDILIAPVVTVGGTFTIAVTREGLHWAASPVRLSQVGDLVGRIRRSIDASRLDGHHRFDTAAARALYTVVVPPALEPLLRRHAHILYYATGALATVPPAILVASPPRAGAATDWLLRSHRFSVLPSLAAVQHESGPRRDGFLGIGAPDLQAAPGARATPALPPLPGARRELTAMAAVFTRESDRLLVGPAATKTALRAMPLKDYGVIAFATHGLLNDAVSGLTEPALVLTPTKDDNGLLTASEVANLHLDADWVILSACDTASGSDAQSASYSGLTRAFIEAGTRALLVSHWPVRDDAAERLTVATLRGTRQGLDRPTALRRAMISLMNDRRVPGSANPAIWAPFVVVEQ